MPERDFDSVGGLVCNRKLVRELRLQRNWTQVDLAKATGYSLRVIAKAESGKPISQKTLEALAQALSTQQRSISVKDLLSCSLSITKQFCQQFFSTTNEELEQLTALLHDEVEFEIVGDPAKFAFAGTFQGRDGVLKFRNLFLAEVSVSPAWQPLEQLHFLPDHFEVFVWGKRSLTHRKTQVTFDLSLSQVFQFRCGKICFMKEVFDTARMAEMSR